MPDYSYIGKGKVFLAKRNDEKLRFVGNCEKVELSLNEETKEMKDFTVAGGGVANSVSRIDKVEISLTLYDYSPENMAMAVFGDAQSVSSGKMVEENVIVYKNYLALLQKSHIKSAIVTNAESGIIYQENIDYELTNVGLLILGSGSITDGIKVNLEYQYGSSDVIQALMNSGEEYHFVFDGLNEAQSGKRVVLDIFRVKFTPAANLSFIGDDFGHIEIKGLVLSDTTKIGAGLSRYFKVEMGQ